MKFRRKTELDTTRFDSCELKSIGYHSSGWVDESSVYVQCKNVMSCPSTDETKSEMAGVGVAEHPKDSTREIRIEAIRQSSDYAKLDLAKKATALCVNCPFYGLSKNDVVTRTEREFIRTSTLLQLNHLTDTILRGKS